MCACLRVSKVLSVLAWLLRPLDFGANFVIDVGGQIVEAVGAVIPGDEGDHGQGSGIFQIDNCVGDDVIFFIEYVAG